MTSRGRSAEHGPDHASWSRARRLAAVLTGSWRRSPPPLEMAPGDLDEITPGLLRSGCGALAWWRIRASPLAGSPAGARLRQAYHLHALEAALHEREAARVVTRLRSDGIEPVLVKGPVIARLYAERGLRAYGDLDVCVRPDQYGLATGLRSDPATRFSDPDLHRGFAGLHPRSWEDVLSRSVLIRLGGTEVRVPGAEDHLALLCLHLLRHGARNPRWLCDVAVAVEARPADFDWARCLGPDGRQADWVACTIGLAHQLLGAEVGGTPVEERARNLPPWLVPSVLQQWRQRGALDSGGEAPVAPRRLQLVTPPASRLRPAGEPDWLRPSVLRWEAREPTDLDPSGPSGFVARRRAWVEATLRRYWPSPVATTVRRGGCLDRRPRLALQAVDALALLVGLWWRRLDWWLRAGRERWRRRVFP